MERGFAMWCEGEGEKQADQEKRADPEKQASSEEKTNSEEKADTEDKTTGKADKDSMEKDSERES